VSNFRSNRLRHLSSPDSCWRKNSTTRIASAEGIPSVNALVSTVVGSCARILAVTREGIERFFKNLASALGHCIFEDAEVLGMVIPALVCLGILWLIGVAVYDLILDPHVTTAAGLDALSIDPDKWFPR
jgi:hypothetical protein